MFCIYFNDEVNPSECGFSTATLSSAKRWVKEQLNGKVLVDDNRPCSEDVFCSSKVARFEVYDESCTISEDFDFDLWSPVYCSPYFYSEL